MLIQWGLIFLVIGIIAAFFGYRTVASNATGIAKLLFFLFILIAIILLISSLFVPQPLPELATYS